MAKGDEHEAARLLCEVELIVRRAAHINRRLIERWAVELGKNEGERDAFAASLESWQEAEEPLPFAVMDLIFTKEASGRDVWLHRVSELAQTHAPMETWKNFREEITAAG